MGAALDLWKRPLDRLLDRRLDQRTTVRVETIAAQVRQDPGRLRDYLVEVILQTTLVGSLIGIIAGVLYGLNSALSYFGGSQGYEQYRWLLGALVVAAQMLSIVGAFYIVRMAGDALTVARRLNPTVKDD